MEFEIFEKEKYLNVEKIGTLKVEIWNVKILKYWKFENISKGKIIKNLKYCTINLLKIIKLLKSIKLFKLIKLLKIIKII